MYTMIAINHYGTFKRVRAQECENAQLAEEIFLEIYKALVS